MKILFAATPAAGHLNPLLTIARMAAARGDEVLVSTATYLRPSVEAAGFRFRPLAREADLDFTHIEEALPDVHALPPGPEKSRLAFERAFLDPMPAQTSTLRSLIAEEAPDIVVTDNTFAGRVALFLDSARPSVPLVSCGITFLCLDRPDGAPALLGFPPAADAATRARYATIAAASEGAFSAPVQAYADAKLGFWSQGVVTLS